jgi:CRP-like cAMP-binding protein
MKQDQELISQLRETSLFHGMPEQAVATVVQKAIVRQLTAGEVLMRRGELGDSLFMIHTGWVKIVTEDSRGEELIINKCGPGETLGEVALLDQGPRSATVIALTESEVFELRSEDFQALLDQRPDLAMALIRDFSSRLRFSTKYIEQAIEWAHKTAEGNYNFIENSETLREAESDEDKAGQLLSSFFQMVRKVKAREDDLKRQLERLTIEIDEVRRKQEFEEIVSTDFYANLKEQARKLRAQRSDRE